MLSMREIHTLQDALQWGGWGLFKRKTTERLAERGYFEKKPHPAYGQQFFITDAGRAALAEALQ
jgi:hypothetical protein